MGNRLLTAGLAAAVLLGACLEGCGRSGGPSGTEDRSQVRTESDPGGGTPPLPVPEASQDQDSGLGGLLLTVPKSDPEAGTAEGPATPPSHGGPVYGPPAPSLLRQPATAAPAPAPTPAVTTPPPLPSPPGPTRTPKRASAGGPAPTPDTAAKPSDKTGVKRAVKENRQSGSAAGKARGGTTNLQTLRRKYADSFIFKGSPSQKRVALTFDDAPDLQYTPLVLDILKRYKVRATFFVVGHRAAEHPEVVKRIVREGHVIGNHTYGHALLRQLPVPRFVTEIERTEQVLAPLAGYTPRLVRPPYGAVNEDELVWLKEHGYLTVNWNVDPEDWRGNPKEAVLKKVLDQTGPGSIILMHSATGTGGSLDGTVGALPDIIEGLRAKGLEPVTLPELLHASKSK